MDGMFDEANVMIAYQRLFDSAQGRIILKDLASRAKLDQPIFESDPYQMAKNEGRRDLCLEIFGLLSVNVPEFLIESLPEGEF